MTTEVDVKQETAVKRPSAAVLWIGRVIGWLPAALLLFSASGKLMQSPELAKQIEPMGLNTTQVFYIGIVELAATILFLIPQTAVLGAILISAYMGGAIATHVRLGDYNIVVQVLVGALPWLSLVMRDTRLRALLPIRQL